ncbi:uncharacterized protein B0P05DRAFT_308650 [Gilbertella persicaria]|uniref:uncharacterized protein n=1 Tax=Gilbertella persicaria TaxID=101096 RepID=UPI00221EF360|nr:uncharacterized protein B0P05DRAFT_308650 [Gilbertella persicaria]KAI8053167.1 hypothetical protein B0P05DRAFT_308650 [Gilbertella persicaria]
MSVDAIKQNPECAIISSIASSASITPTILSDEKSAKNKSDLENHDNLETGINKPEQEHEEKEGGYGWLVIFGTFMVQVTSFGTASCWYFPRLLRCQHVSR